MTYCVFLKETYAWKHGAETPYFMGTVYGSGSHATDSPHYPLSEYRTKMASMKETYKETRSNRREQKIEVMGWTERPRFTT